MFKVGKVIHYYDKTMMASVIVENTLSVGDKIKFVSENKDLFNQVVDLIQVGYKKLDSANRGDMVGLKTDQAVTEGTEIFKF